MNINTLKSKYIIWSHIGFWCFVLIVNFSRLFYYSSELPIKYLYGRIGDNIIFIASFYLAYGILVPIAINEKNTLLKIIKISVLCISIILIDTLYVKLISEYYFNRETQPFHSYIINSFYFLVMYMVLGVLFRLAISGLKTIYQKSQLEKQNLKSELALLRSQINPHFLFNTLNNMHSFAHTEPDKTAFSIIKLSEIMRYMLNESSSERVLLEKEIEYIKSYIALQNLRFSAKEFVNFEIKGDPSGVEISPMIFIPFVENAFKHGDKKQKDKGIDIKLEIMNSKIKFEVCNLKRKVKSEQIEDKSGFGLLNLERRLQLAYPERYKLDIIDDDDKYITKLEIDLANEN